jgi:non-haem Fe2+, alpha-ketoglutarate-dependent halogenase
MPKVLSDAQMREYQESGAVAPIRVFPAARAQAYLRELEKAETTYGPELKVALRTKPHLCLKWIDELVHDEKLLDAVEDVLGHDLLLYNVSTWIKEPGDHSFVSWHQDAAYFPLDPPVQLTVWVALTDSVTDNGNVKYVAGSHRFGVFHHKAERASDNLLSQGQSIQDSFDPARVRGMSLQPGEVSFHNTRTVHFSEPNRSSRRRIGLGVSCVPASIRCTGSVRHTAMLVRGADHHGEFEPEPRVRQDFDPQVEPFRLNAVDSFRAARAEQIALHEQRFARQDMKT